MACPKSSLQTQGGFPSKFLSHLESRHFSINSCPGCSSCSLCCSSGPCLTLTISHHTGQALTRIPKILCPTSYHLCIMSQTGVLFRHYGHPMRFAGLMSPTSQRGEQIPQKYVPLFWLLGAQWVDQAAVESSNKFPFPFLPRLTVG